MPDQTGESRPRVAFALYVIAVIQLGAAMLSGYAIVFAFSILFGIACLATAVQLLPDRRTETPEMLEMRDES